MTDDPFEGGCQCGAVRYIACGKPVMTAICHCRSCRRASAAPMTAWIMFEEGGVTFRGEAVRYASSPGVLRHICPRCGTQVAFTGDNMPGLIDLTVGSLDAPERAAPDFHYWDAERLPWVQVSDGLPRHPGLPEL